MRWSPWPAAPIVAPNEAWTWVDFTDSQCANGAPTGIAVNPTSKSGDVLFYLQGGGACWDETTCYGLKSAAQLRDRLWCQRLRG